jgi:hypothetical protein
MAKRVVISVIADIASAVANFGKVDNALGKMGNRARAVGGAISGAGQSMTAFATVPIVGAQILVSVRIKSASSNYCNVTLTRH